MLNYAEIKNHPQILDAYDNKGLFLTLFFSTSVGSQSPPGSFFLGSGMKDQSLSGTCWDIGKGTE